MAEPAPTHTNFATLYRATLVPLRRYLARLVGSPSDAQDLAQDAYVRVFVAMSENHAVREPQAFLFTAAKNLALNRLRRRHLEPISGLGETLIDATASPEPGVPQLVMARQDWAQFEKALAELPPGCRRVLLLRRVDRLSPEEIAARLGIARSSVDKHLARALRLLRQSLQSEPAASPSADEPIEIPVAALKLKT
jgi:RNA polymerase sigma factor (sigma-70 family)